MTDIVLLGKRYTVYSSYEEARSFLADIRSPLTAAKGTYVATSTGHYVPITAVTNSKSAKVIHKLHYLRESFAVEIDYNEDHIPFDLAKYELSESHLRVREILVAELVAWGIAMSEAIKTLYADELSPTIVIERRLLKNKKFLHYLLFETDGMMSLREELLRRGMDEGYLADQVKKYADGEKVPANLRMWALNLIHTSMSAPQKPQMPILNQAFYNVLPMETNTRTNMGNSIIDQMKIAEKIKGSSLLEEPHSYQLLDNLSSVTTEQQIEVIK